MAPNAAADRHIHPVYKEDPVLYVFKRPNSRFYYAETSANGRQVRKSLKTDRLTTAFALAGDWYKDLLRATLKEQKDRKLERLSSEPTIGELFKSWRTTLTPARRKYHDTKWGAIGPFWQTIRVTEVTPQLIRDFYQRRRREKTQYKKPPTNNTLHKDVTLLRLILRHAVEDGHLTQLPIIPQPGEIVPNPRPWLTMQEWKHLSKVSQERIDAAQALHNQRLLEQRVELDDQMTWMVSTMQRVGEMRALRFRDCHIEKNADGDEILRCEIPSDTKHGARINIGRRASAEIYKRRKKWAGNDPEALIFPVHHRDALTGLLKKAKLHVDAQTGFERNFKSFRATAISLMVLEGVDLLFIARNAGTSYQMIDSFYSKRLTAEMGRDVLTARRKRRTETESE